MRARLVHEQSGRVLADRLESARSTLDRMRGLLGRDMLHAGEGMWISRCACIHTWFMRFSIDVLFVDADFVVSKVVRDLSPWRMAGALGARHTVELPAGTLENVSVVPGDTLRIEDMA